MRIERERAIVTSDCEDREWLREATVFDEEGLSTRKYPRLELTIMHQPFESWYNILSLNC